jgi:hyperosmotically inducible protein
VKGLLVRSRGHLDFFYGGRRQALASDFAGTRSTSFSRSFLMSKTSTLVTFILAASTALAGGWVWADEGPPLHPSQLAEDTEDTERNVRDRDDTTLTPEDQPENERDRKLTAAVRRAIVKDESLSTNAHNVKIITHDATVTLRGPVESAAEKAKLEKLALKVRGVQRVDNQLEVNAP